MNEWETSQAKFSSDPHGALLLANIRDSFGF